MPRIKALLSVFVLASAMWTGAASAAEQRVALVIGNDSYRNLPADKQLRKAVADAEAVGDTLANLGFRVIRGRNLSRQEMYDKLAELTGQLGTGDVAAVFFAGHGVAIGGVNYLLPSDVPTVTAGGEVRIRGAAISEPDLTAEIQSRGVRLALMVIDACRDNPFPQVQGRSVGQTRGLADAKPARGIFTIYSAGIGQSALDALHENDPARNSVFTRIFVEHLSQPGLHLGDVAVEVRERVAKLALQAKAADGTPIPHEQTPAYYDQTVGGRIYLAGLPSGSQEGGLAEQRQSQGAVGEAAAAWALVKDTTSSELLEAFIKRFGDSFYADLARARLKSLQGEGGRSPKPETEPRQDDAALPADKVGRDIVTLCDKLAGYAHDPGRTLGIPPAINISDRPAALQACEAARREHPHVARFVFLSGRIYDTVGDHKRAFGFYKTAAESGYSAAMGKLASLYKDGVGVSENRDEAVLWFERAVKLGNPQAMVYFADMLLDTKAPGDGERGLRLYQEAAAHGYVRSMLRLGFMLENGKGKLLPRNPRKALEWYRKAADTGDTVADYHHRRLSQELKRKAK